MFIISAYHYIIECYKEKKEQINSFYKFIGCPSTLIVLIITFFTTLFILFLWLIVFFLPFIYYTKDFYCVSIDKKRINYTRDGVPLFRFEIITYIDTIVRLSFKVGYKINSYFLLFSKFSDINISFGVPNKNFDIVEKRNKDFYVIKCKKNKDYEFVITINIVNKKKESSLKIFKVWYSKQKLFNNFIKKKEFFLLN